MRFRRGLVVGKFAPLHRGHELVIRQALAMCDEVVILSWANPELSGCGPARRGRWLETLFPETIRLVLTEDLLRTRARGDLAGWTIPLDAGDPRDQRRFTGLVCRDLLGLEVDAVFTSEDYGEPLARELERVFGGPPGSIHHVPVDPGRLAVPISGTLVRGEVHRHREALDARVYADFVERWVLLGGESSGKSTLVAELAESLGTSFTTEYGRDLWEERGGHLEPSDMLAIAERQVEREEIAALEAARRGRPVVVCDTSPLTTLFYSREMFGDADPRLEALAERAYDVTVLCAPDFPFVQDGTRREPGFRERQHAWYERELKRRGVAWVDARGTLTERRSRLVRHASSCGFVEVPTA